MDLTDGSAVLELTYQVEQCSECVILIKVHSVEPLGNIRYRLACPGIVLDARLDRYLAAHVLRNGRLGNTQVVRYLLLCELAVRQLTDQADAERRKNPVDDDLTW